MFFSDSLFKGSHWYDRLWNRLEVVAEAGDERSFNTLMDMRAGFADADTDEEIHAVKVLFENWETINA